MDHLAATRPIATILNCLYALSMVACAVGCAPVPLKIETWDFTSGDRTYFHRSEAEPEMGLVVRQLEPGKAQVGVEIVNDTTLTLTVPMDVQVYVDGAFLHGEKGPSPITLEPGARKRIMCRPIFRSHVTRPVVNTIDEEGSSPPIRIYKGRRVIYVTLGPYKTPEIVLDLSPENQVPARFSTAP